MSAFRPCIGTRAQIETLGVSEGQFMVSSDTGEIFIDFNGKRIRLAGSFSSGEQPGEPVPNGETSSLLTSYSVVNRHVAMSESVTGGGPGSGILSAPEVLFEDNEEEAVLTSWSIAPHFTE